MQAKVEQTYVFSVTNTHDRQFHAHLLVDLIGIRYTKKKSLLQKHCINNQQTTTTTTTTNMSDLLLGAGNPLLKTVNNALNNSNQNMQAFTNLTNNELTSAANLAPAIDRNAVQTVTEMKKASNGLHLNMLTVVVVV